VREMERGLIRQCLRSPTYFLVALLLLAGLATDTVLVSVLRGVPVEEPRNGSCVGYYEGLIQNDRKRVVDAAPEPPPGHLPFSHPDAGIVRGVSNYLRWEMRANVDVRWNGTEFHTNSMGYRTPEIELEKSAGVYRVLVFGSSNTMGHGVDDEAAYPRLLERWLNDVVGTYRKVEVVNLAVAGDSPTRRLFRLQNELERFDADWLLCDISVFDPWLEELHIRAMIERAIDIPFPFVREAIRRAGVAATDSFEAFHAKFHEEAETLLTPVFAGWRAEAQRLRIPLTVVLLPRADSKDKSSRVLQRIRSLAESHDLPLIDVSDAFDDHEVDQFRVSEWDKHPSRRGHELIFDAVRQALQRQGGLPRLPFCERTDSRTVRVDDRRQGSGPERGADEFDQRGDCRSRESDAP
jgi:hypothetical protein